jgi:hypothetical protein
MLYKYEIHFVLETVSMVFKCTQKIYISLANINFKTAGACQVVNTLT